MVAMVEELYQEERLAFTWEVFEQELMIHFGPFN
jgi:hypothetical protein